MTDKKLHKSSYENFRLYLDKVYYVKREKSFIPLSLGYPMANVFPLPYKALEKLSPLVGKKEKARPGYGWESGSEPLRQDIITYENTRHKTSYTFANISITAGGSYSVNRIMEHIFNVMQPKKKELLIVSPTFYRMLGRMEEYAKINNVTASRKNTFLPTGKELSGAISKNTGAIFICNPSNPGYNYLPRQTIIDIVKLVEKKNIYLVIDEVGDNFYHKSFFRYPKIIQSKMVVRIGSSSKAYQLAEYRLGYVIADKSFIGDKSKGFIKLVGDDMGNPPLAANEGWQILLQGETAWIKKGRKTLDTEYERVTYRNEKTVQQKCNYAISILEKSEYVTDIIEPDSSFNLTFRFTSSKIHTDIDFFQGLLEKKGVSLVPCSGFGLQPEECYLRLTFAVGNSMLKKGMKIIVEYLKEIN